MLSSKPSPSLSSGESTVTEGTIRRPQKPRVIIPNGGRPVAGPRHVPGAGYVSPYRQQPMRSVSSPLGKNVSSPASSNVSSPQFKEIVNRFNSKQDENVPKPGRKPPAWRPGGAGNASTSTPDLLARSKSPAANSGRAGPRQSISAAGLRSVSAMGIHETRGRPLLATQNAMGRRLPSAAGDGSTQEMVQTRPPRSIEQFKLTLDTKAITAKQTPAVANGEKGHRRSRSNCETPSVEERPVAQGISNHRRSRSDFGNIPFVLDGSMPLGIIDGPAAANRKANNAPVNVGKQMANTRPIQVSAHGTRRTRPADNSTMTAFVAPAASPKKSPALRSSKGSRVQVLNARGQVNVASPPKPSPSFAPGQYKRANPTKGLQPNIPELNRVDFAARRATIQAAFKKSLNDSAVKEGQGKLIPKRDFSRKSMKADFDSSMDPLTPYGDEVVPPIPTEPLPDMGSEFETTFEEDMQSEVMSEVLSDRTQSTIRRRDSVKDQMKKANEEVVLSHLHKALEQVDEYKLHSAVEENRPLFELEGSPVPGRTDSERSSPVQNRRATFELEGSAVKPKLQLEMVERKNSIFDWKLNRPDLNANIGDQTPITPMSAMPMSKTIDSPVIERKPAAQRFESISPDSENSTMMSNSSRMVPLFFSGSMAEVSNFLRPDSSANEWSDADYSTTPPKQMETVKRAPGETYRHWVQGERNNEPLRDVHKEPHVPLRSDTTRMKARMPSLPENVAESDRDTSVSVTPIECTPISPDSAFNTILTYGSRNTISTQRAISAVIEQYRQPFLDSPTDIEPASSIDPRSEASFSGTSTSYEADVEPTTASTQRQSIVDISGSDAWDSEVPSSARTSTYETESPLTPRQPQGPNDDSPMPPSPPSKHSESYSDASETESPTLGKTAFGQAPVLPEIDTDSEPLGLAINLPALGSSEQLVKQQTVAEGVVEGEFEANQRLMDSEYSTTDSRPNSSFVSVMGKSPRASTDVTSSSSINLSGAVRDSVIQDEAAVEKQLRKRKNLLKELLDTEKAFCQDMDVTKELYKGTANACSALTMDDVKTIFGNIDDVVSFAKAFLEALKAAIGSVYTLPDANRSGVNSSAASINNSGDEDAKPAILKEIEADRRTYVGEVFGGNMHRMEVAFGKYCRNHEVAGARLVAAQNNEGVKIWLQVCANLQTWSCSLFDTTLIHE